MSKEDLIKSVEDWKDIVETNAYADSVGAFAESFVSSSPIIDKTSTWAGAGTAAVAALSITNIDKMLSIFSASEVKCLFSILAISILFSLIQKYLSSICASSLNVSEQLKLKFSDVMKVFDDHEKQIEEISKKHELGLKAEFNLNKLIEAYVSLFPKWYLFFIKAKIEKSFTDRNYGHKFIVNLFIAQSSCMFLQFISILLFVIAAR